MFYKKMVILLEGQSLSKLGKMKLHGFLLACEFACACGMSVLDCSQKDAPAFGHLLTRCNFKRSAVSGLLSMNHFSGTAGANAILFL